MSRVPRGLVGVVHLHAMPGDPRYRGGGFEQVELAALHDAEALVTGGVGALILENFGSAPFTKGTAGSRLEPHQVAVMALLVRSLAGRFGVSVGVNCLRNDAYSAIGIAAASMARFVRVNVHVGAYVTDQGIVEGEAATKMRYRRLLGAEDVAVLADVHVKHASPLGSVSLTSEVHDVFERGLADGVIVTGAATGSAASRERVAEVRAAADTRPVILGSGLVPENAADLLPYCDAAIVGTFVKRFGRVHEPVDAARVRELGSAAKGCFHKPGTGAGD